MFGSLESPTDLKKLPKVEFEICDDGKITKEFLCSSSVPENHKLFLITPY